jgi:hypothetical protein
VPPAPAVARGLLAALALALLGAGVALLWRFTVDDAYITLRYSRHLAIGLGPTFNETGPRAEGYTTFLWMLLLAIPHWLRVDALAVAKALGVVCSLVTALLSARWARRVAGDAAAGWAAPVAALLFVSRATTPVHAVSGMETALYTLLLTAVFASASEAVLAPEGRWARAWPLFALLAGLTRPEGNLVAGGTLVAVLALSPRVWRGRVLARAAALWWVPLAAYQLWRWHWYGLPLPLAFYLKLSDPELLPGARFVLDWMRGHGFALGVLLLPALVPPPRSLRPALTGVLAADAFFTAVRHIMGYQHRYLAPLDPALCVLAAVGIERVLGWVAARSGRSALLRWAPLAAVGAVVAGRDPRPAPLREGAGRRPRAAGPPSGRPLPARRDAPDLRRGGGAVSVGLVDARSGGAQRRAHRHHRRSRSGAPAGDGARDRGAGLAAPGPLRSAPLEPLGAPDSRGRPRRGVPAGGGAGIGTGLLAVGAGAAGLGGGRGTGAGALTVPGRAGEGAGRHGRRWGCTSRS